MRLVGSLALVAVALAALAAAAFAPPVAAGPASSSTGPAPHPALPALAKLNGATFDVAFMRELIPVHEEAIEMALAATLNADHPELLRWNQVVIDRKSAQVRQMLAWLQAAGAAPGRRNANAVTDPVKKVRSLQGAALEKTYLPLMAAHLEQSVALATLAARKASRPEVRAMAQQIVQTESREAAMLRDWLRQWYGK
ncbi:MAG: DUF305 domain-containing protein [Firmicutes bacterium]|nr:DUF305 domain-containing protein [Bacillota bacterium]